MLPRGIGRECETLRRLPGGIEANELTGDLLHRLARPPLRLLPVGTAEAVYRGCLAADITRDKVELIGRDKEPVSRLAPLARCILQEEVLTGRAGDLALHHLDVAAHSMLLVHDIVAGLE